jgi:hypothetical protein
MSAPASPIAYVGVNGSIGTVHFRSHDANADQLVRLFDEIRPLIHREEITDVKVSGHVSCTASHVMTAFIETLQAEVEERGKRFRMRSGACPEARTPS